MNKNVLSEVNIVIGDEKQLSVEQQDLIFGPLSSENANDNVYFRPKGTKLIDILTEFKFFPSKRDAKRNNFDREIKDGFSQLTIGKRKRLLTIFKVADCFLLPTYIMFKKKSAIIYKEYSLTENGLGEHY